MSWKYENYFLGILPKKETGMERMQSRAARCAAKRSALALRAAQNFTCTDVHPWIRAIAAAAHSNGLSVRRYQPGDPVPAKLAGGNFSKSKVLIINGKLCELHLAQVACRFRPSAKRRYSCCRIGGLLLPCDIVFREIGDPRIFVFPTEALRKKLGKQGRFDIYIPEERTNARYPGRPAAIDFFQYENAWSVLQA